MGRCADAWRAPGAVAVEGGRAGALGSRQIGHSARIGSGRHDFTSRGSPSVTRPLRSAKTARTACSGSMLVPPDIFSATSSRNAGASRTFFGAAPGRPLSRHRETCPRRAVSSISTPASALETGQPPFA